MKIVLIILTALTVLIGVEAAFRRGKTRPLAARLARPPPGRKVPGMEATEVEGFDLAMRRNAPLGKMAPQPLDWRNSGGDGLQHAVEPVADDEDYAARWHNAFGRDTGNRKPGDAT